MARKKHGCFDVDYIDTICLGIEGKKVLYRHGFYGLGLSVDRRYGSERKAFFFEGKVHGRTVRRVIGDWPTWTVPQAEKAARELRVMVDSGTDPREQERAKRAAAALAASTAKARRATLRDAWEAYLVHRADSIKPLSALTVRDYHTHLRRSFSDWADKKLTTITDDAVLVRHKALVNQSGAAQANQAMRYLRAVLNFAAKPDQFAAAFSAGNPVGKLTEDDAWAEVRPKKVTLRRTQLRDWWEATDLIENSVARAYLRFLLLVGCRREEALSLAWADVNFRWRSITFRDTKTGGDRQIPLTNFVAQLLQSLPRRNQWVFSSEQSADGRLREPAKFIQKIEDKTGIRMPSHGLRKSFASLSEWPGIPDGAIRYLMGHVPGNDVHEVNYRDRGDLDLLAMHLQRYEDWLLAEAGQDPVKPGDQVGLRVVQ